MRRAYVVMLSVAVATLLAQPGWAEPKISFTDTSVIADGITPGGQAVWFSVSREWPGDFVQLVRRDRVDVDEDRDSRVSYEMEDGIPAHSIWAVVDVTTGKTALATPEGYPLRLAASPTAAVVPGSHGTVELLVEEHDFVELLLVRPGAGVWALSVGDGGASDDGVASDRAIIARPASMRSVSERMDAPESFHMGDVLVLIDPNTMECSSTRLTGAK